MNIKIIPDFTLKAQSLFRPGMSSLAFLMLKSKFSFSPYS